MSGTDLIVDGVLTVNENFVSGQLGIRLIQEASYANGFPEFTDSRGEGDDTVALLGSTNYTVHGNGGNDYVQRAVAMINSLARQETTPWSATAATIGCMAASALTFWLATTMRRT